MHSLYFVVVPRKEASTPRGAIAEAEHFLEGNQFVCSEGLWGGGKCDWYEVGGRWSGMFTELMLPEKKRKAYEKELQRIDKEYHRWWDEARKESDAGKGKWEELYPKINEWREREILQAWKKHFPGAKVLCPEARKGTFSFHYVKDIAYNFGQRHDADDAVLMTKKIWRKFRKEWVKKDDNSLECVFTDTYEELPVSEVKEKDALGTWWVVIDYHI